MTSSTKAFCPQKTRVAEAFGGCDNARMTKQIGLLAATLAGGTLLLAMAQAQQPSAAGTQQAPATGTQQAPAAKPQQTPAAKPGQSGATKSSRAVTKKLAAPQTLNTPKDKASYAVGMSFGTSLRKQSVDVDPSIVARGLRDALAGGKTLLTEEEQRTVLTQLQADLRKKQQEKMVALGVDNKKQGEAFLAANKTKEGVVALPSGLQYKVLQEGAGPKPAPTDTVVCNYRGTLLDNSEFDSSYKRGQPATFPVTGVIKGWTEALQLMPVGSKWQLFIPPELAYGERGAGAQIGPNATLIFEVELVSIKPKDKPPTPPSATAPATPPKPTTPPRL
jgi:FKBP-type peptidyl-prolyl cis-trans isomerase FklB